jgi:hypothetical protein
MSPSRTPPVRALLLGVIPFVAMCFSVSLWDRIEPRVLGVPFNLAWLVGWIVISTGCLAAAYRIDGADDEKSRGGPGEPGEAGES